MRLLISDESKLNPFFDLEVEIYRFGLSHIQLDSVRFQPPPDVLLFICPCFAKAYLKKCCIEAAEELKTFFKHIHPLIEGRLFFIGLIGDIVFFEFDGRGLERSEMEHQGSQGHLPLVLFLFEVEGRLGDLLSTF